MRPVADNGARLRKTFLPPFSDLQISRGDFRRIMQVGERRQRRREEPPRRIKGKRKNIFY
jgi:hypothetical protein